MTQQHPITPPPDLIEQWIQDHATKYDLARHAAQWGADQELEACCEWLDREGWSGESRQLRAARRPKPPSLKEQALKEMDKLDEQWEILPIELDSLDTIRRALEQLND